MAEKGFGVKEINLIGASGTPTIESPNNLNLNAVNVAISTNVSIGGTLTVTGNVSVGGTLTYEDVTNIDSIGIVTARTGLKVLAGGANVVGVVTATTFTGSGANLTNLPAGQLTGTVADARISTLTASKLSGALPAISGANLTNLDAADLASGTIPDARFPATLPAISGANLTGIAVTEAPVVDYTITANGSSAYRFHGGGVNETGNNPDLYLIRGQKYRFNNTTGSGHPFRFRTKNVAIGGQTYSDGVTGTESGVQFFTVPVNAPASLVYQCTIHQSMVGNIHIRGADGDGIINTGSVGVQTANITDPDLVGAGSSLVGLYIGDGSLLFSNNLSRTGGYYITTGVNALNAGPVTLNSDMKLDGTWVIV